MPRIRLAALPKRKAEFIEPMECAPVTKLLDGTGWFYEVKLDGYRAIAVKSGQVNLFSRRRKSFSHQYPHLVEALEGLSWAKIAAQLGVGEGTVYRLAQASIQKP